MWYTDNDKKIITIMIPEGTVKIQNIPKELKRYGINISYRGLRHYINLGLLDRPLKLKGQKEKFYYPAQVASCLLGLKYINSLFNFLYKKIYIFFIFYLHFKKPRIPI